MLVGGSFNFFINLSLNPSFHLENAVPSVSLVVEFPAVAPIDNIVAKSGVISVLKLISFTKFEVLSFSLNPNTSILGIT